MAVESLIPLAKPPRRLRPDTPRGMCRAMARDSAGRESILVFDSGLGGLTVFREVAAARPHADFVYVADDAAFPYGALAEDALVARVVDLMGELIEAHPPNLIVIACNTASTIVLPALRKKFLVPFVGTVPAIKPACAASATRRVSVLGTEATVAREYTRALIRDYAQDCEITLVGSKALAAQAEAELIGTPVGDAELRAEIAPCFRDDGARTDTIVLACTTLIPCWSTGCARSLHGR